MCTKESMAALAARHAVNAGPTYQFQRFVVVGLDRVCLDVGPLCSPLLASAGRCCR